MKPEHQFTPKQGRWLLHKGVKAALTRHSFSEETRTMFHILKKKSYLTYLSLPTSYHRSFEWLTKENCRWQLKQFTTILKVLFVTKLLRAIESQLLYKTSHFLPTKKNVFTPNFLHKKLSHSYHKTIINIQIAKGHVCRTGKP